MFFSGPMIQNLTVHFFHNVHNSLIPCWFNSGHLGFSTFFLTFSYMPHNRAGLSQPRSSITSQSDLRHVELSVLCCQSGRGEITTTCLGKSTSKTRRRACPDCVQIQTGGRQTDAKKTTNPNKNNSNIYIYICDKYRLKSLFDSLPLFSFQNSDLQSSDLLGWLGLKDLFFCLCRQYTFKKKQNKTP